MAIARFFWFLTVPLLLACSGGGGGGGGLEGKVGGETGPTVEMEPVSGPQEGQPVPAEAVYKISVPVEYLQIPCSTISGVSEENKLIITIAEDQVERCTNGSFNDPPSLISKAYAQDAGRKKVTYEAQCLYPCRVEGNSIVFRVPERSAEDPAPRSLLIFKDESNPHAIDGLILSVIQYPNLTLQLKTEEKNESSDQLLDQNTGNRKIHDLLKKKVEESAKVRKKRLEGMSHLQRNDTKYSLQLCVGQTWYSGVLQGSAVKDGRSDNSGIAGANFGSDVANVPPPVAVLWIDGKQKGQATVTYDMDVAGMGSSLLVIDVTVEDCDQPKVPPVSLDKPVSAPPTNDDTWEWKIPPFGNSEYYFGGIPECRLSNGSDSYLIQTGGIIPLDENVYSLILEAVDEFGGGGYWYRNFKGNYRLRKIHSSDSKVAAVFYSKEKRGLVISSKGTGTATISFEGVATRDIHQVVPEEAWKTVHILVRTYPFFAEKDRYCPGETKPPDIVLDRCPVIARPAQPTPIRPDHTVEAPTLSGDERLLADKLEALFNPQELPEGCKNETIQRQVAKIAHTFLNSPDPEGIAGTGLFASCVTCANQIAALLRNSLKDERVACLKITTVGRIPGWLPDAIEVHTHTVTVVGPACTELGDNWIVLDSWFPLGNVFPYSHRKRIFRFGDWRYDKYVDFHADWSQSNLPKDSKSK